jgi:hypothetical protein
MTDRQATNEDRRIAAVIVAAVKAIKRIQEQNEHGPATQSET